MEPEGHGSYVNGQSNNSRHWSERAAHLRLLAVKMDGLSSGFPDQFPDLAVHFDELAEQAASKKPRQRGSRHSKSPPNGKRR